MPKRTVRYAKSRLARFDTIRVYSYEISSSGIRRRAGVYGKGK